MQLPSNISKLMKIPKTGFHIPITVDSTLLQDVRNFLNTYPEGTAQDFLDKWAGYRKEYEREFIESVFRKVKEE